MLIASAPALLSRRYALPVDQAVCAAAPYFLGNVPSTVTATIVQERDSAGWSRDSTDFFGFGPKELCQFREGWAPSDAFADHYWGASGCLGQARPEVPTQPSTYCRPFR